MSSGRRSRAHGGRSQGASEALGVRGTGILHTQVGVVDAVKPTQFSDTGDNTGETSTSHWGPGGAGPSSSWALRGDHQGDHQAGSVVLVGEPVAQPVH